MIQVGAGSGRQRFPIKRTAGFNELFVKVVFLLLASPHECANTGVTPPAQCAPLLRLLRRRNIPAHFRISQSGRPTFSWLDRILLTVEEFHRRLSKLLRVIFRQETPSAVHALAARPGVWIVQLFSQKLHKAVLAAHVDLHPLQLTPAQVCDPFDPVRRHLPAHGVQYVACRCLLNWRR